LAGHPTSEQNKYNFFHGALRFVCIRWLVYPRFAFGATKNQPKISGLSTILIGCNAFQGNKPATCCCFSSSDDW
jgi:hypothetical protein